MAETELTKHDFTESAEPFRLFAEWLADAEKSEPNDPNAVALATVDPDGLPNVRMVLLKGFDEKGFVFYTNFESAKGAELLASMKAAMCFHWKSLRRQVRIRGPVEIVSAEEADAYYASRPRGSRIGAWASKQSRPLESRFALEKAVRSSVVLGLVGAGGIGQELKVAFDLFQYRNASMIILAIFLIVLVMEICTDKLRARIQ